MKTLLTNAEQSIIVLIFYNHHQINGHGGLEQDPLLL